MFFGKGMMTLENATEFFTTGSTALHLSKNSCQCLVSWLKPIKMYYCVNSSISFELV